MHTILGRFVSDERGTTVVEFALVAPVVILILVSCVDFARALNAYVTLANASREGARYATLHPAADDAAIRLAVKARAIPLDTAAIGVIITYDDGSGSGPQPWPDTGVPESSPSPRPIAVRVATSYDWHASTWVVGAFFSITSGSRTFGSESTMVAIR
ncbi:MAG: TadE/TadG family type IV pilus assembly protein [Candidatus Limnocylindria bacterium]